MTTATTGPSAPLGGQVSDNRRRDWLTGAGMLEHGFDLLDGFLLGWPPSQRQQLLAHVGLHRLSRPARSPTEHLVKFFGHLAHLYRRHSAIVAPQRYLHSMARMDGIFERLVGTLRPKFLAAC
jgi:hypothetical protein